MRLHRTQAVGAARGGSRITPERSEWGNVLKAQPTQAVGAARGGSRITPERSEWGNVLKAQPTQAVGAARGGSPDALNIYINESGHPVPKLLYLG